MKENKLSRWLANVCSVYDRHTKNDSSIFYSDEFNAIKSLLTPIPEDKLDEFVREGMRKLRIFHHRINIRSIESGLKQMLKEYRGLMDSRVENLAYPLLPEIHNIPPKKEEE